MICRLPATKVRNGIGFEYTTSDCVTRDIDGADVGFGWIVFVVIFVVITYIIPIPPPIINPIPQIPPNSASQI